MIKNERQLKITKSQIKKLAAAIADFDKVPSPKGQDSWVHTGQKRSMKLQLEQLEQEVRDYSDLKDGKVELPDPMELESIPALLIQHRIQSGLTQEQLAKKLNLAKQQIQKYEQTNYSQASMATVLEIASVLSFMAKKSKRVKTRGRTKPAQG